jgi:YesN/AraC family two-component response regulator
VFKKYCGKSLSNYVKERRILHAVELLQTTDYSVATIGQMVGYEDKAFFYKKFKEITGETPTAFRK